MKKGFSLVEVVVALAVFVISFVAILSCYLLGVKAYAKQTEYLYFETICLDIDKIYDSNPENWQESYFGSIKDNYYYDSKYQLVTSPDKYTLSISYQNEELILSIFNNNDNYYVIENLNYGKGA